MANQHVNQYRLAEYASRQLRLDPLNREARWVRIAIGLVNGAVEFPEEDWSALLRSDFNFDARWVIYDSLRRSFDWGNSTAGYAANFLRDHELWSEASATLKALVAGDHDYARLVLADLYDQNRVLEWAHAALLDGQEAE